MRVKFDEIAVRAKVKWRDPVTNKPRVKTKKFWQTVSPFNRNSNGEPKSREQIIHEISTEAGLWKLRTENDIRSGIYPT